MQNICRFLESFYDATCVFSGSKYPTSNLYFPEVFLIQLNLSEEMKSSDVFMRRMAHQMFGKFDKYWSEYSLVLAIAVIFDPRYKIQFVEFSYKKLYGDESFEFSRVREKLFSLFDEYMHNSSKASSSQTSASQDVDHGSRGSQQHHSMNRIKAKLVVI